ncbi:MAG: succinate dehydrogenase, hydrophobic membrane anchor protein [Methylobacteriaceae bacterium]|nr:succinate dehydrogenase, hydrophobic membrane anchor protein [Methylobacteriaceae bacterium]
MSQPQRSLRTELGRIRHLGAARSGTAHMWILHVTAVAMVPLTFGFLWVMLSLVGKDYNAVRAALAAPLPAIVLLGFVLVGIWHMQIGMKAIIDDYVPNPHQREWFLIANLCACWLLGLACVYAILKISFV